jgi:hypothetical protein
MLFILILKRNPSNYWCWQNENTVLVKREASDFGGLAISILAAGTQVRGFKPSRSRRIFQAKNPQHAFLRRGSKAVGPMSQLCGM